MEAPPLKNDREASASIDCEEEVDYDSVLETEYSDGSNGTNFAIDSPHQRRCLNQSFRL
jgi:hypothetical protein